MGVWFTLIDLVKPRLTKGEMKKEADIRYLPSEGLKRDNEQMTGIGHAKLPTRRGQPLRFMMLLVQHLITHNDSQIMLVLMIGLRFIFRDGEGMENISNLLGDFILPTICDKGCHSTMIAIVVRQCVHKLLEILDTIYLTNQGVSSIEELDHGAAIINSWSVTHCSVSGDWFISSRNVKNWTVSLKVFLEVIIGSIVRGDLICYLDDIFILQAIK